jgi:predicted MPP superfamily phosphohydrolase
VTFAADHITVRRNRLTFASLPAGFENFTILHLTDLHADISVGAMRHLISIVGDLEYDICVLTGDYRGKTYGHLRRVSKSSGNCEPG